MSRERWSAAVEVVAVLVCVVAFGLQGVIRLMCLSQCACVCAVFWFAVLAMLVDSSIPLTSILWCWLIWNPRHAHNERKERKRSLTSPFLLQAGHPQTSNWMLSFVAPCLQQQHLQSSSGLCIASLQEFINNMAHSKREKAGTLPISPHFPHMQRKLLQAQIRENLQKRSADFFKQVIHI